MAPRSLRIVLVVLLLIAVTMFCLSDLARAAAPSTETMGCGLCDGLSGCGTAASKPLTPIVGTVVAPIVVEAPMSTSVLTVVRQPLARCDRLVLALASRSPPSA